MPQARTNGIAIEYELDGPEDAPVLVMIHGLGAQLIRWPQELCDRLIAAGFRLLRLDNRDVGLSTHMDGAPVPDLAEVVRARSEGRKPELPYTLSDMAADTAGLLDALGIASAHVLGVSLGGMVAQSLAIEHPSRVRSLNIMMSHTGNPDLPPANPDAMAILSMRAPDPSQDREAYIAHQILLNRTLGSPDYPAPEAELREFAIRAAERAYDPSGPARQNAAIYGADDRRAALRRLTVPTLVIHGANDPRFPPEYGEEVADTVSGSWLVKVNGMGHDLPRELFGLFVATIAANCARAEG
jgi:pimeloyl-ACP methyl ester carboxylesterase